MTTLDERLIIHAMDCIQKVDAVYSKTKQRSDDDKLRRRSDENESTVPSVSKGTKHETTTTSTTCNINQVAHVAPSDVIALERRLGRGSYCNVYRARVYLPGSEQGSNSSSSRSSSVEEQGSNSSIVEDSSAGRDGGDKLLNNDEVSKSSSVLVPSARQLAENTHYCALKCLSDKSLHDQGDEYAMNATCDLAMEGYILSKLNHEHIIKVLGVSSLASSSLISTPTPPSPNLIPPTKEEEEGDIDVGACYHQQHRQHVKGYFLIQELLSETLATRIARWKDSSSRAGGGRCLRGTRSAITNTLHSIFPSWGTTTSRQGRTDGTTTATNATNDGAVVTSLIHRIETVAIGIAKAMEYLHSKHIMYRDLKPDNVGFTMTINENGGDGDGDGGVGVVKLFDFGFARELHCEQSEYTDDIAGSLRHMAPEVILTNRCNLSSDVYSFGVLLYEICTLQKPFHQFYSVEKFQASVTRGNYRPSLKRWNLPPKLRDLIEQCWDSTPSKRPTFTAIRETLEEICKESNTGVSDCSAGGRLTHEDTPKQIGERGIASVSEVPCNTNRRPEKKATTTRCCRLLARHHQRVYCCRLFKSSDKDNSNLLEQQRHGTATIKGYPSDPSDCCVDITESTTYSFA